MRAAGLTLLLALVMAAEAPAQIDGQRPADPQVAEEVRLAIDFWHQRNVIGCPLGVESFFVDQLPSSSGDDVATERGGGCRVWLNGTFADRSVVRLETRRSRIEDAAMECAVIVHGVGHALGLDHSPTGVMAPIRITVPWDCRMWARALVGPRKRRGAGRPPNIGYGSGTTR